MLVLQLFDWKTWTLALLIAFALVFFHQPAGQFWTINDHDGEGFYPAQDCGRNFWLLFKTGNQQPCVVRGKEADSIADQAMKGMKSWGDDIEGALDDLTERIANILNEIQSDWSMF